MKTALIAVVIATVCAAQAFAADNTSGNQRGQGQGPTVAQKKAEILAHIDERITKSQAEKSCIQSASSHDEMRACREKFRPQQRGGQMEGGPRGDGQQGRREQPMR